jgi:hypothetical protein
VVDDVDQQTVVNLLGWETVKAKRMKKLNQNYV